MNVVLIGPSGAGKGTQAQLIAPKFNLVHIGSGDLFRDSLTRQTDLGLQVRKYMDAGELVPDEVTQAVMERFLHEMDKHKGVILDGFPRTKYQAETLDSLLSGLGRSTDVVIYLKVSDETVIKRIPGRLTCTGCQQPYHETYYPPRAPLVCDKCGSDLYQRNDDTPKRARARLRVFHRQTAPVVDYYQGTGKLVIIDGEQDIEQVNQVLCEVLESVNGKQTRMATREESQEIQALKSVFPALARNEASYGSLDLGLLGAPGSGKGTQAERLARQLNLVHIATGNLFRDNLKNETELGKLAKTYMDRGELVPDDVTEAMVRERLAQPDTLNGFILDGFPRTLSQAEALTEMLTGLGRRLDGILFLNVSDEEIINRLSERVVCRECQIPFHQTYNPFQTCPVDKCRQGEYLYQRDDDNPETVRARLKTFYGQTAPLIDYYKEVNLLIEIDGEAGVDKITERILRPIRQLKGE
jgi:adenylate kinase